LSKSEFDEDLERRLNEMDNEVFIRKTKLFGYLIIKKRKPLLFYL